MNQDSKFAELVIIKKIEEFIELGRYKNINDFTDKNPNFNTFIHNNKLDIVINHSKESITDRNYLQIIDMLRKKYDENVDKSPIEQTSSNSDTNYEIDNIRNTAIEGPMFLSDINYSNLYDDEKLIFGIAYSFESEIKHQIKLDIKNKVLYDNNVIYDIIKNSDGIIMTPRTNNNKVEDKSKNFNKKNILLKKYQNKEVLKNGFIDAAILAFVTGSVFGALYINLYIKMIHAIN